MHHRDDSDALTLLRVPFGLFYFWGGDWRHREKLLRADREWDSCFLSRSSRLDLRVDGDQTQAHDRVSDCEHLGAQCGREGSRREGLDWVQSIGHLGARTSRLGAFGCEGWEKGKGTTKGRANRKGGL